MNENPVVLQPGMVTSNEPGVYKAEKHGIRTENLTLVRRAGEGMFGDYLEFETITLCPICKKELSKDAHRRRSDMVKHLSSNVYDQLAPDLNEEENVVERSHCSNLIKIKEYGFNKSVRGFTRNRENCFLADNAVIIGDVKTGRDCSIWFSTVLRGDVNSIVSVMGHTGWQYSMSI